MTKCWSREHTQHWITQLEHRIEDIDYYLKQTVSWCEDREIYNDQAVFSCAVMTVVWVSHMRNEPLSKREVFEIIGIADYHTAEDAEYGLNERFHGMELEELLEMVVMHWD